MQCPRESYRASFDYLILENYKCSDYWSADVVQKVHETESANDEHRFVHYLYANVAQTTTKENRETSSEPNEPLFTSDDTQTGLKTGVFSGDNNVIIVLFLKYVIIVLWIQKKII